jgi:4-hydroxy-tetrahydrodipicolinate synthase
MSTQSLQLRGAFTALITPFSKDGGRVDYESFSRLLRFQIDADVHGVVVCGTTGEASTLSEDEYVEVVSFVREQTRGRLPCIAGISVSATSQAVEAARQIAEIGCDGILLAAPPYNKPTQAGLIEHVRAVRHASKLPIIAYNIPGRSAVGYAPATLGVLSREGTICGIKDSTGSIDTLADTMLVLDQSCQVLSGEDALTLGILAYGGTGVISASANALPREFVALMNAWQAGEIERARKEQLSMLRKLRMVFVETNPVPVKTVLALQGVIDHSTVRLPLVPLSEENLARVKAEFGL